MTPAIAVDSLSVSFAARGRTVRAVDDVSFAVPEGGAFGLVGESGSGKSTVLRVLAGLVGEWSGQVAVLGQGQGPARPKAFYRLVQMVFQDPYGSLHPGKTVDAALAEPLAVQGLGDADRRIAAALADVGLGTHLRFRLPHQLSGGQRQRVAIARALILEPRILLLDEPTSALDVSVQAEILALLERLRRERGLTLVLVSHNLAVVARLCDRLLVMQGGLAVEAMTAEALRAGRAERPYTRELLQAAAGFGRG